MSNKIKMVAIIGKSASGKDTLQKKLCKLYPNLFHPIVSMTTRPKRTNEQEGIDYFFVSKETFGEKVLKNEMLEVSDFNNWFYGTPIESLKIDEYTINIGVFNPEGVACLLEDDRIDLMIIYLEADDRVRVLRSLLRDSNVDVGEIARRYLTDEKDFADIDFYHLKINTDRSKSLRKKTLKRYVNTILGRFS